MNPETITKSANITAVIGPAKFKLISGFGFLPRVAIRTTATANKLMDEKALNIKDIAQHAFALKPVRCQVTFYIQLLQIVGSLTVTNHHQRDQTL